MARTHGWAGSPPETDEKAVALITEAARRCIARSGGKTNVSEVATELGVSRATIYRYFQSTEALLFASSITATGGFIDRLAERVARIDDPADLVIESIAFAIEDLRDEPYLASVLTSPSGDLSTAVNPLTIKAFGRAVLDEIGRDWLTRIDEATLEELIEWTLMTVHWTLLDVAGRSRQGSDLREYLSRWLRPSLKEIL